MVKKNLSSDFLFAQPSALAGLSRFFDFAGAFDVYNGSETPAEADAKAMYADWAVVGNDIRESACQLKADLEAEEETA